MVDKYILPFVLFRKINMDAYMWCVCILLCAKKFSERLHLKLVIIVPFKERVWILGGCLYYPLHKKNKIKWFLIV